MNSLHLAWQYAKFHRGKTAILVCCVTLTLYLPLAASWMLASFEEEWLARAESTPLVAGAKGSRFDLALHALYFRRAVGTTLDQATFQRVTDADFGPTVPIYLKHSAQGFPVVGTSADYFDQRGLVVASGSPFLILGDAVLGSGIASKLELEVGDRILSDPENVFDIAGGYPLNMLVRGILEPSGTPDDNAVFVDIKSAYVIEGYGHGHVDVAEEADDSVIMDRSDSNVVANAALEQFTTITPENVVSFHFHAEFSELPLTAMLVFPPDEKSSTLLRGRFEAADEPLSVIVPTDVIEEMLALVLRIKTFFDATTALLVLTTLLFLLLVVLLSLKLRSRERRTMDYMGCSKGTITALFALELLIVFALSVVLALILSLSTAPIITAILERAIL